MNSTVIYASRYGDTRRSRKPSRECCDPAETSGCRRPDRTLVTGAGPDGDGMWIQERCRCH